MGCVGQPLLCGMFWIVEMTSSLSENFRVKEFIRLAKWFIAASLWCVLWYELLQPGHVGLLKAESICVCRLFRVLVNTLIALVSSHLAVSVKFGRFLWDFCNMSPALAEIAQSVLRLATDWTVRRSNPGLGRDYSHRSIPALGPTQPPIRLVPGLSRGQNGRGVALTTHPT
jgi:hypothetical protein